MFDVRFGISKSLIKRASTLLRHHNLLKCNINYKHVNQTESILPKKVGAFKADN